MPQPVAIAADVGHGDEPAQRPPVGAPRNDFMDEVTPTPISWPYRDVGVQDSLPHRGDITHMLLLSQILLRDLQLNRLVGFL
jgi:hypothetical protein